MLFRILIFLSFIGLSLPLHAAEIGPNVQIPGGGTLRGNFIETHTFADGKTPLQSEGHFVLAPAYGVIWNVEKPFPLTIIITPDGMSQRIGNFRLPSMPASRMPVLAQATPMLTDALTGQWQNLQSSFIVTRKATPTGWEATMVSRPTAKLPFQSIIATGSQFVDTANVAENDGSADSISFSNETASASPPTAAEIVLFSGQ